MNPEEKLNKYMIGIDCNFIGLVTGINNDSITIDNGSANPIVIKPKDEYKFIIDPPIDKMAEHVYSARIDRTRIINMLAPKDKEQVENIKGTLQRMKDTKKSEKKAFRREDNDVKIEELRGKLIRESKLDKLPPLSTYALKAADDLKRAQHQDKSVKDRLKATAQDALKKAIPKPGQICILVSLKKYPTNIIFNESIVIENDFVNEQTHVLVDGKPLKINMKQLLENFDFIDPKNPDILISDEEIGSAIDLRLLERKYNSRISPNEHHIENCTSTFHLQSCLLSIYFITYDINKFFTSLYNCLYSRYKTQLNHCNNYYDKSKSIDDDFSYCNHINLVNNYYKFYIYMASNFKNFYIDWYKHNRTEIPNILRDINLFKFEIINLSRDKISQDIDIEREYNLLRLPIRCGHDGIITTTNYVKYDNISSIMSIEGNVPYINFIPIDPRECNVEIDGKSTIKNSSSTDDIPYYQKAGKYKRKYLNLKKC